MSRLAMVALFLAAPIFAEDFGERIPSRDTPQVARGDVREETAPVAAPAYTPAGTLRQFYGHTYRARGDGWWDLLPSVPTYRVTGYASGGSCPPSG